MPSQLAVQLYTVRDFTKTAQDFAESLRKIAEIGYKAVQLSAVGAMSGESPEVSAHEARKMLDDHGLACIATHRSWEQLSQNTQKEIDEHRVLGCAFTAIGGIPKSYGERGGEGYSEFVRDASQTIAALRASGILWGHHNHSHEFVRVSPDAPRTLFDILIDDGGPDYLLEVDIYWAWQAGIDPVSLMLRCKDRAPIIHLKDREMVAGAGNTPTIAAIGEGNLPWDTILPACQAANVAWYAIEQDTVRRDPFDCLRSSYEFLTARGL